MHEWFDQARYGLVIHFGLYSALSRSEWVMNREELTRDELRAVADQFRPDLFDADEIADLAVRGGMRYLVFTTMHHEGFRMYDSALTDFCSTKRAAKRDFVAEIIAAGRKRGLRICLYHSLNNWYDQPDATDALEDKAAYEIFIKNTHARIKELVTKYNPIDTLWYDGWWPFNAEGWQAQQMNEMVRKIQPHIMFNGRNGLPGDFATPEQHLTPPHPWRRWEACVTLNDNWGYHAGDHHWKTPMDVLRMLIRVAQHKGNLILNIGPRGDGSIPEESKRVITAVGDWLKVNGEAIYDTDPWTFEYGEICQRPGQYRGDWVAHGPFTVSGNNLYHIVSALPEGRLVLTGLEVKVEDVQILGGPKIRFEQKDGKLVMPYPGYHPEPGALPTVFRIACNKPAVIYKTGGVRIPTVEHPRYDPMPSDLPPAA